MEQKLKTEFTVDATEWPENGLPHSDERCTLRVQYSPETGKWYWDNTGYPFYTPTEHGREINLADCTKEDAEAIFMVNLFHISSYDLVVARMDDRLAVFTVIGASMNEGDYYCSGEDGFGYRKVVLYLSSGYGEGIMHYLLAEGSDSKWRATGITLKGEIGEFLGRTPLFDGQAPDSEEQIIERLKESGVDLSDKAAFVRVDIHQDCKPCR